MGIRCCLSLLSISRAECLSSRQDLLEWISFACKL